MTTERFAIERRAAVHAALADPMRLRIVDALALGDASSSELVGRLEVRSNLLAHHLKALEAAGLISRHASEGDRRRQYLRLVPAPLAALTPPSLAAPRRVLFVCTKNSARSHLAAALWRRQSRIPAVSAGTQPASRIAPGAIAAAARHDLRLPRVKPRHVAGVISDGDLIVTVCDRAHEELRLPDALHWSVPDPIHSGRAQAFDAACDDLSTRVAGLAPRLQPPA